jgi:hypothetical protein
MPYTKVSPNKPIIVGFSPDNNNFAPLNSQVTHPIHVLNDSYHMAVFHLSTVCMEPLMVNTTLIKSDQYLPETVHITLSSDNPNIPFASVNIKVSLMHINQRPITPRGEISNIDFFSNTITNDTNLVCFGIDLSLQNSLQNLAEILRAFNSKGKNNLRHSVALFCHKSQPTQQLISENQIITFAKTNEFDMILNNAGIQDLLAIYTEIRLTEKYQLIKRRIIANRILPSIEDILFILNQERQLRVKETWGILKEIMVNSIVNARDRDTQRQLLLLYKPALMLHYDGEEGGIWCRWFKSKETSSWREVKQLDPANIENESPSQMCIIL